MIGEKNSLMPKSDDMRFQEKLQALFQESTLSDSLQRLRAKAWEHFLELGLPTRKSEVYQYVRLRHLFSKDLSTKATSQIDFEKLTAFVLPECQESLLIFVNGIFRPDLSRLSGLPKNVVAIPLSDAMRTFGSLLSNQMSIRLQDEKDPFAALNAAFSHGASFVYVPPKTLLESPIQILNVFDSLEASPIFSPRAEFVFGTQSEGKVISTAASLSGEDYFVNAALNLTLEEGSKAYVVQSSEGLPAKSWHFEALRASLKRDSSLKTVSFTDGSQGTRFDYRVSLVGENADCSLNGLWVLKEKREAHTHVLMDHLAPHCRSMQFYKGVLNEASHSSFEGKIFVHHEAQKTQAFQLNNNLLLSDQAFADSKPNLEIFADDVKASHGATVGQLDEEQLFYLTARGVPVNQARTLLVLGYCKEIIDMISSPTLLKKVLEAAQKGLYG